jgi:hypothetical protein
MTANAMRNIMLVRKNHAPIATSASNVTVVSMPPNKLLDRKLRPYFSYFFDSISAFLYCPELFRSTDRAKYESGKNRSQKGIPHNHIFKLFMWLYGTRFRLAEPGIQATAAGAING